ncbi:MAG: hypothetical protein ACRYFV_20615 [Janthinobacterium lividum]
MRAPSATFVLCDLVTDLELFTVAYDPIKGAKLTRASSPFTQSGLRGTRVALPGHKLYIATTPGTIHYVGRTTNILTRLAHGHRCRTTPRNGYHGYKWLPLPGLHLFICTLPRLIPLATAAQITPEMLVERLESELVFHIRATTGQWPAHQHEIHFHNLASHPDLAKLTTQTAQELYAALTSAILEPIHVPKSVVL